MRLFKGKRAGVHRERGQSPTPLSWETPVDAARIELDPPTTQQLWAHRPLFEGVYAALQPHVMVITDIGAPEFYVRAAIPTTVEELRTRVAAALSVNEERVQVSPS